MGVINSMDAARKILIPLGIDIKNAISCTIRFNKDDVVTAEVLYMIDIPDQWDQIQLKKYQLVEIEDDEEN